MLSNCNSGIYYSRGFLDKRFVLTVFPATENSRSTDVEAGGRSTNESARALYLRDKKRDRERDRER